MLSTIRMNRRRVSQLSSRHTQAHAQQLLFQTPAPAKQQHSSRQQQQQIAASVPARASAGTHYSAAAPTPAPMHVPVPADGASPEVSAAVRALERRLEKAEARLQLSEQLLRLKNDNATDEQSSVAAKLQLLWDRVDAMDQSGQETVASLTDALGSRSQLYEQKLEALKRIALRALDAKESHERRLDAAHAVAVAQEERLSSHEQVCFFLSKIQ